MTTATNCTAPYHAGLCDGTWQCCTYIDMALHVSEHKAALTAQMRFYQARVGGWIPPSLRILWRCNDPLHGDGLHWSKIRASLLSSDKKEQRQGSGIKMIRRAIREVRDPNNTGKPLDNVGEEKWIREIIVDFGIWTVGFEEMVKYAEREMRVYMEFLKEKDFDRFRRNHFTFEQYHLWARNATRSMQFQEKIRDRKVEMQAEQPAHLPKYYWWAMPFIMPTYPRMYYTDKEIEGPNGLAARHRIFEAAELAQIQLGDLIEQHLRIPTEDHEAERQRRKEQRLDVQKDHELVRVLEEYVKEQDGRQPAQQVDSVIDSDSN